MNWKEFLTNEKASRDTIDVKRTYIDIAGDLVSGILLSQIVYWNLPDNENKIPTRLRVKKQDELWLAKKREDWWDECRITPKQFDRAIKELETRQLVKTKLFKFDGNPTKHIHLNQEIFLEVYCAILNNGIENIKFEHDHWFLPKGENGNLLEGKIEIDEKAKSLTENTTENTTKNTKTKDSFVAEKSSDEKKPNFPSIRERLKGDDLKLFDFIANNTDKPSIIDAKSLRGKGGKLYDCIIDSPNAVKSAYNEMVKRNKTHFEYFRKIYIDHLKRNAKQILVPEDTTWIKKYSIVFADAKKEDKTLLEWNKDGVPKALAEDAARLNITVEEVVEKITKALGK